jgi:signal transduction histidine kinase
MFKKIKDFMAGTPRRSIITGILFFSLVSAADYSLANEISLDVFYFIPIFILTWRAGKGWGVAASLAGVFVWLTDERIFAPDFSDQYHVVLWNALVRLAFFYTVAALVDELRRIVEKERASSKLKSAMIHTVSHEFNNALTGLSAGLFLLRETDAAGGDETRSRLYDSMEGSQHKLSLYVKNILNEARMEEGRFKVQKKPVALRALAAGVTESVQEMLRQKEIKLSVELPELPVLVNADAEAMALVISNLLGNAVKYTRKGGEITIRIEPAGAHPDSVVFSVEDSGIGISLADMKKITSGFYRTEEGQAQAEGFGLGLRICNDLLALHGSRLEIASEKGKGSRFYFELKALPPGAAEPDNNETAR